MEGKGLPTINSQPGPPREVREGENDEGTGVATQRLTRSGLLGAGKRKKPEEVFNGHESVWTVLGASGTLAL